MESNIISDYSLDSFIKNSSDDENNNSDKKRNKADNNIGLNDVVNYSEIAKKYGFKEKNVKTILNKAKNTRSIFLGEYSLNPYLGCSFDCEYCYINGSKYADSTNSFYIKSNSIKLLRNQLKQKAKSGERAVFLIGSATDPYIDIEKELFITKDILKLFNRFRFPVHIVTKSDLVLRDIDILREINDNAILPKDIANLKSKVMVTFSFSTVDSVIARLFEPNAPSPKRRLEAMKILKEEGFLVGVSVMPMLPYISDNKTAIDEMFAEFKNVGCDYAFYGGLTLFGDTASDSKTKYYKILKEHFPDIIEPTKKIFGNNDYSSTSYQNKIYKRFADISEKYSIRNKII
ncbi:radical SAM protein [Methanobrevibacter sp. TMH8]|uniref:SPL family radical SAM protein n=1 Tax=Methanobrevibacter sp. TMH8 TaxID=2848611 RepID=UPI001CCA70F5|nr:radical SAM protein [Methanobrevibacter sp. TMH8]